MSRNQAGRKPDAAAAPTPSTTDRQLLLDATTMLRQATAAIQQRPPVAQVRWWMTNMLALAVAALTVATAALVMLANHVFA